MKVLLNFVAALLLLQIGAVYSWDHPKFATPGQFPHQISLVWTLPPEIPKLHSCGGSILNKLWVLSSGYCLSNIPHLGFMYVKAGVHNTSVDDEHVQIKSIDKLIIHEKYEGIHTLANLAVYDIGLIKLKSELSFNDRVKAIQLPKPDHWVKVLFKPQSVYNLILSGWSSMAYGALTDYPDVLRTVNLPVIANKVCNDSIKKVFPLFLLDDMQMCTRPLDGNISGCIGDHGGPLIQQSSAGEPPVLVGVVSWSSEPCTTKGLAPVYSRVSYFVKWIEARMKDNKKK